MISLTSILFGVSFACAVLFFFGAYAIGNKSYKEEHRAAFSLLTDFPFELYEKKGGLSSSGRICLFGHFVFCLAASSSLLFLQAYPSFSFLLPLGVIISILEVFFSAAFIVLTFVPAYDFKRHLSWFVILGGVSFLTSLVLGLTSSNLNKLIPESYALTYGFMIAFFLLALLEGGVALNPKLKNWAQLESEMQQDGSILTKRPKPFPLAFSEWLLLGFNALNVLLFGIEIVLTAIQIEG